MRLINTETFQFAEFTDAGIPKYAILSHRWIDGEEVSYTDFISGAKRETLGYAKIDSFRKLAHARNIAWCWVDTCCIDKSSSAELSEAINAMHSWYSRAVVCFAYLSDVIERTDLGSSQWLTRGWTLQELLAPVSVEFFNKDWQQIGDRATLGRHLRVRTGIDEALLRDRTLLKRYSVAHRMSWAARRKTTRVEDEAYCLMGIFGVNMPLLYGEGHQAFQRLQEQIFARGDDSSLFAWGSYANDLLYLQDSSSILANSPEDFLTCAGVLRGFATHRILWDITNRGMMVSIHRSYDRHVLSQLLEYGPRYVEEEMRNHPPLFLTIPLSCYRVEANSHEPRTVYPIFLCLKLDDGKWRRAGMLCKADEDEASWMTYEGRHHPAYSNNYVQLYIHNERRDGWSSPGTHHNLRAGWPNNSRVLHLRDRGELNMGYDD